MNKYKAAALLMMIHGGLMEIGGALSFIFIVLALEPDKTDIGQYFSFKFPYYQDNLCMMIIMGTIYGIVRVIGAVGLMKNKMWGFIIRHPLYKAEWLCTGFWAIKKPTDSRFENQSVFHNLNSKKLIGRT